MKRAVMIALLALLALALAGCGGGRRAADEAVPTAVPEAAVTAVPEEAGAAQAVETDQPAGEVPASDAEGVDALTGDAAVQLLAVNVGKGDALVLRVGEYLCLIDTGKPWALGRVSQALELMSAGGEPRLDAVFITHTDDDHTGGLTWLAGGGGEMPQIGVENWCASAMYTGVKAEKHPVAKAAAAVGAEVRWLRRGDEIPLGDTGAVLKVLAPASLYKDKDDNNSLVMLLESAEGRMLFTGDMELPEEAELLGYGDDLSCAVLKVPNHGDDDTTSEALARAAGAQLALISTDSQEKPGTPDPGVVSRLEAAGSRVVVTQDSSLGLLVTLSGGVASVQDVPFGAPAVSGVYIAEVDASDDRIVLGSSAAEAVDLAGCYLCSDRGNELYAFPSQGAVLEPGAYLAVGTNSTDGDFDLLWDDKKVVNKKKTDVFSLYDSWGRLLDRRDNGL
ncbi:MAG: MBL fold metallo-hydrolase [Clostridia bacterium]|nr:MBL fold metallo-hydrolase [Clostridia bacterium]